jgi:hypothetical protein
MHNILSPPSLLPYFPKLLFYFSQVIDYKSITIYFITNSISAAVRWTRRQKTSFNYSPLRPLATLKTGCNSNTTPPSCRMLRTKSLKDHTPVKLTPIIFVPTQLGNFVNYRHLDRKGHLVEI